jgi:hypothetical protein
MRPSNTASNAKDGQHHRPNRPGSELTSANAGQDLCGAPRRNRTGDPILTMEPPGTAVRNAVFPGRVRPSRPKLCALSTRSYAFSLCVAGTIEAANHWPLIPAQHPGQLSVNRYICTPPCYFAPPALPTLSDSAHAHVPLVSLPCSVHRIQDPEALHRLDSTGCSTSRCLTPPAVRRSGSGGPPVVVPRYALNIR